MKDATTRNLATLEVIETSTPPTDNKPPVQKNGAAQTVEDLSSTATWSDDDKDHREPQTLADAEPAAPRELSSGELETIEMPGLHAADGTQAAGAHSAESYLLDEPATLPLKSAVQSDDSDTAAIESPEEAAQRIDAWFRSAKTIEDVPPVDDMPPIDMTAIDEPSEFEPKHAPQSAATNATIELGSAGIDELHLSDDFELEQPTEAAAEPVAPWDDSQHIDELLANIQDEPAQYEDELEVGEAASSDAGEADHLASDAGSEPSSDWMPEDSLAIKPGSGSQQRSRSLVRTLVLPAVCGLWGLALGYYVLLWLRGPQIDFLDAAKYLPKTMLPASFGPKARQVAGGTMRPIDAAATQPPANEPAETANDAAKIADAAKPTDAPAEKPASFIEPADTSKIKTADDDRYATTAPTADKTTAPAAFNPEPPAAPVNDTPQAPAAEPVHITGVPSFSVTDLAAAIVAAKDAEAGLVNGNLTDGHDVARAKGFSYSILADLAQKSTFNDPSAADAAKLQQDANDIYRTTLATPHARDEVAQIVPKWIASPNRKQGGVFFAGTITASKQQGSVVECDLDLGAGHVLPVLLPPALAEKLPTGPVTVVGYIVDKPAERISGYTGATPEAVFATKLVPLQ